MSKKHKKTRSPIIESPDKNQTIKSNKKPKIVISTHKVDKVQLLDSSSKLMMPQIEVDVPDIGREVIIEPSDLSIRNRFIMSQKNNRYSSFHPFPTLYTLKG